MAATLLTNIKLLAGTGQPPQPLRNKALASLSSVEDAWLLVEDDEIAGYGPMSSLTLSTAHAVTVDLTGQTILPAWCDSHTHLVFAASREEEFIDKIKGLSYAEIAANGGGILHSAHKLQQTSEDELFAGAWKRLLEISQLGTGAVEIKSGYGLTVQDELKMLRVIKKLKEKSALLIRASFLGAHTYPLEYRDNHDGYINLIINEMLPVIAAEKLADYIDVFCEQGFFSPEETITICKAGQQYGLKPKIHANQLGLSGGVQAGVKAGAISVDHLEAMDDTTIQTLAQSGTMGTLLPSAAFFFADAFSTSAEIDRCGLRHRTRIGL